MGLLGLVGEVITEFKADVSELKDGLDELQGAERALAEEELAAAEARNEHSDHFLEQLAKIGLAIAAVKEVGEKVWEGYKDGLKEARLETAAMGVDIEKLSDAAGGLKTNMELLEFAAKAHTGAFKLNTEQLEIAEKAMRALTERGYDATQVQNAFTEALVSGRVRGLEQFGIIIDKTGLQMDEHGVKLDTLAQKGELVSRMFKAIAGDAAKAGEGEGAAGEEGERAATQLANSWDKLKIAAGQLVNALEPLIKGLADLTGYLADTFSLDAAKEGHGFLFDLANVMSLGGGTRAVANRKSREVAASMGDIQMPGVSSDLDAEHYQEDEQRLVEAANQQIRLLQYLSEGKYFGAKIENNDLKTHEPTAAEAKEALEAAGRALLHGAFTSEEAPTAPGYNRSELALPGSKFYQGFGYGSAQGMGAAADMTDTDEFGRDRVQMAMDATAQRLAAQVGEESTRASRYAASATDRNDSLLKKTFGPVGEFDLYKKGFEGLTSAVGSMYDAIVSGSEPAGKAFEKMIAQSVEAVGKQMAIEAIKEAAYALGNLAMYNYDGAAKHGAAAAEFAIGAVAAGAAASALGYGSSSSGASSGGGGYAGGGAGGSVGGSSSPSNQTAPVIVVMNDPQAGSLRQRQAYAQQMITTALGIPGVRDG